MSEASKIDEPSSYEKALEELHGFLDIPVKINIRFANRSISVRDILQFQPDSVVELNKSVGEKVDILINERLIAFGEILEVGGRTGIRLINFNAPT
jgi:flagellar motor switch protein FliN/FliY